MAVVDLGKYLYLPLIDAKKSIGLKVNLFAVVTEISRPKRSRGHDFVMTLKVADQSSPGLYVNFFAEDTGKLPNVQSNGDIICLRRVVMRVHNGECYGSYDKHFSSFALFEGKARESFKAYQTSINYQASNNEKELLSKLRTHFYDHKSDAVMKSCLLRLNSVKTETVFDLICRVLHVCEISDDQWMIYVWDGTDTPCAPCHKDLNAEGEDPLPLNLDIVPLSRKILQTFPCVGTVFRIVVRKYFEEIPQLSDGCWVKLCNLTCELHYGIWRGLLHGSSKVHILSDEDENVKSNMRDYQDRLASGARVQSLTCSPRHSYMTGTDFEKEPCVALIKSLACRKVTHKFKSIVRVVAAYPWKGEHLRSPVQGHYRVRLTLEDSTARIHAYIHGDDGVKFFGGHPEVEKLSTKMRRLLGIKENIGVEEAATSVRDPPWVCCCLKSYYLDKSDTWGSRRYRIFGTYILD
ncbi:protection of telomeres protein 1a-like isoform X2 [Dioscorea cayenensis subsp. rotundata]|uniref:Protection of telomeres protein 1a-like isoform X2 n=1 Tax=Dioscorea cayennensis subsp. rotundata TaxID=55577 RepID=A0AB40BG95_DIOCR|nr:protection of telomeres protein 1a-like isoform X2 [Dioscorea cayenensis subsp. rotundata]